jgi:argininosuccinate synthase
VIDAKDEFANEYISKGIKANASYQGSSSFNPDRATTSCEMGCENRSSRRRRYHRTWLYRKGMIVRIEGVALALNPDVKIIAPVRNGVWDR